MKDEDLRKLLKAKIKEAGSLEKWILSLPPKKKVSTSWAGVALYEDKPFPPKVARALGYKKVKTWVRSI
jgi:hypothetical protein